MAHSEGVVLYIKIKFYSLDMRLFASKAGDYYSLN